MAALRRAWLLAVLAGVLAGAPGCDLASLLYFVMPEAREEAKIKQLASEDEKKNPHVVILTYNSALETRSDLIQADRQLSDLLAKRLTAMAKENKEKLTIVPQRKVEEYKNTHPGWERQELSAIGKALAADYVVYLEINSLTLRDSQQFFRGRANITVNLLDLHDPDSTRQEHFSRVYPSDARSGVDAFDTNPVAFRQAFMDYLARELSYYFSHYPKRVGAIVECDL
jgi:hypothetical protein